LNYWAKTTYENYILHPNTIIDVISKALQDARIIAEEDKL
jgi:hypothetical protein